MGDKTDKNTIAWLAQPEEHDYPAAQSYLNLLYDDAHCAKLVRTLHAAPMSPQGQGHPARQRPLAARNEQCTRGKGPQKNPVRHRSVTAAASAPGRPAHRSCRRLPPFVRRLSLRRGRFYPLQDRVSRPSTWPSCTVVRHVPHHVIDDGMGLTDTLGGKLLHMLVDLRGQSAKFVHSHIRHKRRADCPWTARSVIAFLSKETKVSPPSQLPS